MACRGQIALASLLALLLATLSSPAAAAGDPNPSAANWVDAAFTLTLSEDLTQVVLDGTFAIHEAAASSHLSGICGASCTADELRDIHRRASAIERELLVSAIEAQAADRARDSLEAVAGSGDVSVGATLDRATIEGDSSGSPYDPPVVVVLSGRAPFGASADRGLAPEQVEALFAMGARATLPLDEPVEAGTNLTVTLQLPTPLGVLAGGNATISDDGRTATWTVDRWREGDGSLSDAVTVGRIDVVVPEAEDLAVYVTLDLSDIDIHYANLLSGVEVASLDVAVSVVGTFGAVPVPDDLQSVLDLPTLSADALRIGIDAGLIKTDQVTSLEGEARVAIASLFSDAFGIAAPIDGGFDEDSLSLDALGTPLGTGGPILLDVRAAAVIPLPPESLPTDGVAAFTVATIPLPDIPLPSIPVPGGETHFTIVLPPGLDLGFTNVVGGDAERTTTEDGRTAITFTRTADDAGEPATLQGASIAVGSAAVVNVLWPVLLFLFIVLVVLPALLIGTVIARRRRRRRRREAVPAQPDRPPAYVQRPDYRSPSDEHGPSD